MTISQNCLYKLQMFWNEKRIEYDNPTIGDEDDELMDLLLTRLSGYLDACVDYGFMTFDESTDIFDKLKRGEKIYSE